MWRRRICYTSRHADVCAVCAASIRHKVKRVVQSVKMEVGSRVWMVFTGALLAAAELAGAEYRLDRDGDALAAFADGRRFAVLSPATNEDWKIEADASGSDFIRFRFAPAPGKTGTFRFPEIRLDVDGTAL